MGAGFFLGPILTRLRALYSRRIQDVAAAATSPAGLPVVSVDVNGFSTVGPPAAAHHVQIQEVLPENSTYL